MTGCILDHVNIKVDAAFLYKAMTAEDQYLFSTRVRFPSQEAFVCWLQDRLQGEFHDCYIVRGCPGGEPLGYVHNYDFSLIHGTCQLALYIVPEHRGTGIGAAAALQFMDRLFKAYPLRRLYSTIYDYNKESLRSNLDAGFEEEGALRDYRYYNGRYYDLHYLSMTRERYESTLGRLTQLWSV